jgi:hypothetical protein
MLSRSHRAYFLAVGLFALWVGLWGYPAPAQVERALPWSVPPLHARFIAAMYLAGAVAMLGSLAARQKAAVRIPLALASIWTGALFIVSMFKLAAFDFAKPQVWFWMGAYLVYPLWGAWLYGRGPRGRRADEADPALLAVAAVCLVLAAALAVAPAPMSRAWPWPLPPLLASIYAGPFLAWGLTALMLAREASPEARRIALASMLAFTLLALLASLMHLKLFHFDGPAAWLWFGGFSAAALVVGWRLAGARQADAWSAAAS